MGVRIGGGQAGALGQGVGVGRIVAERGQHRLQFGAHQGGGLQALGACARRRLGQQLLEDVGGALGQLGLAFPYQRVAALARVAWMEPGTANTSRPWFRA